MASNSDLVGTLEEDTNSVRFTVFRAGTDDIVCTHQIDIPSNNPKTGWCEQDPQFIVKSCNDCIEAAVKQLTSKGANPKKMIAIGIVTQRDTIIVWNRTTGEHLTNAITELDTRANETVEELLDSMPQGQRTVDYLRPKCGLPLASNFAGVKLRWLKHNVEAVKNAIESGNAMCGTIDSWLIYQLCGGVDVGIYKTDLTNASRTMLMNIETREWDDELLAFFDIPKDILPEICSNAEQYGELKTGALEGVPITACLAEPQAALVAQQCLERGQAKVTYGAGCTVLFNGGSNGAIQSKNGLHSTIGYQFGRKAPVSYILEGNIPTAGAAITWIKDQLELITSVEQIEQLARSVDDTLDVYFVPAFNGLLAPHWNKDARGIICGLSEDTTCEHIARATLESICFQVRDIIDAMAKDCDTYVKQLFVDGEMSTNELLLQLQADLMGTNVCLAKTSQNTALGVALAAYKAINTNYNMSTPLQSDADATVFKPQISPKERDVRYERWNLAVEHSLDWDNSEKPQSKRGSAAATTPATPEEPA